mgnify:CR=1 FL=1
MISIIIPIYNSEKTLRGCLDGISAQTFSDWECILVYDGSRDKSLSICQEYAGRDNRFKVYHKENGGVSSARNIGLDNAKGDFVTFCDSDDSVTPNWLEDFDVLSNKDLIIQGYKYRKATDVEYTDKKFFESSDESLSRRELLERLLEYDNFGYLWTRCFRRSLIEEYTLRFNTDYIVREDEDFILHFMTHVKRFKTVSTNNYLYNEPDYSCKYKIVNKSDVSCTLDIIIQCLALGFKVKSPKLAGEVTRISNNLVKGFLTNKLTYDFVSNTKREIRSLHVDIDRLPLPFYKYLFYKLFFLFF